MTCVIPSQYHNISLLLIPVIQIYSSSVVVYLLWKCCCYWFIPCSHKPWIAWDILFVMSSVTGNLCNKCPKWLIEQNSSYSDSFNAISGFTSNSRAPGGPVTFWWPMWGSRLPKLQNVPIWLKCAKTTKKCAKLKKSQNHQKQHFQG